MEEKKKPIDNKKGRLIRDDPDDDISDDEERVDMLNITGAKEREERREQFYSVQRNGMLLLGMYKLGMVYSKLCVVFLLDSEEESDPDMNEWENQQIRKGVTGAQVIIKKKNFLLSFQNMKLIFLTKSL